MTTGLGVDHGGDVVLALEVCEVEFSPLGLLSVGTRRLVTHPAAGSAGGWIGDPARGVMESTPQGQEPLCSWVCSGRMVQTCPHSRVSPSSPEGQKFFP